MAGKTTRSADAVIDALPEPRRSQMRHLHEVIKAAVPDAEVQAWDYAGDLIGYGEYEYHDSKGKAGTWFPIGLANRKAYISLYSMGRRGDRSLVSLFLDRFPGEKAAQSCLNIKRPELVDEAAVRDLATETWAQFADKVRALSASRMPETLLAPPTVKSPAGGSVVDALIEERRTGR
jgi:hypothetical protein